MRFSFIARRQLRFIFAFAIYICIRQKDYETNGFPTSTKDIEHGKLACYINIGDTMFKRILMILLFFSVDVIRFMFYILKYLQFVYKYKIIYIILMISFYAYEKREFKSKFKFLLEKVLPAKYKLENKQFNSHINNL